MRCLRCGRRIARSCPEHGSPEPRETQLTVDDEPPPEELAGHRIVDTLGRGGFGAVYLPGHAGPRAAIKLARRNAACLRIEADAMRRVGPPHVPEVYDVGATDESSAYLVMEYVEAPTLATWLLEPHPIAIAGAQALRLLDAVAAVHARGLVHRDLKPENVLVPPEPAAIKLIDFGLVLGEGITEPAQAESNEIAGTADYMSPEQCEAEPIDVRSDVYALGVIVFEMLVQRPPFFGN